VTAETSSPAEGGPSVSRGSVFWRRLAAAHIRDLQTHGFDHFKRRQALRYFTWQWDLRRLPRSEQMAFLLRHSTPAAWIRCALTRANLAPDSWKPLPWRASGRWLYTFAIRLLWLYAEDHGHRGVIELDEPRLGAPPPVRLHGRLISQDLANSALEVKAMARALDGRRPASILEVGAGYGRVAYALLSVYPEAHYTIVDIEPALSISRWYLTQLFDQTRLSFIAAGDAGSLTGARFDLALSISSLQEMTSEEVTEYLAIFDRVATGGVVYLKQWEEWHNPDDGILMRFRDWPIPSRWHRILHRHAAVQTRFIEAAWALPEAETQLAHPQGRQLHREAAVPIVEHAEEERPS
jgi:putative sugar O-methyltransferase